MSTSKYITSKYRYRQKCRNVQIVFVERIEIMKVIKLLRMHLAGMQGRLD